MDVFGYWIPNALIWIIAIAVVLYWYGTWKHSYLASFGYKGPKPLPFLGTLNLLFDRKEYFAYCDSWMKAKYGDMVAMYTGRQHDLVVYDPDIIKEVLVKDFTTFTDRRPLPARGVLKYCLVDLMGDDWRRVRGLVSPFFTTSKIRNHMNHVKQCIDNLEHTLEKHVDEEGSAPLDAKKIIGGFTMESICLSAFGVDVNCRDGSEHKLVTAANKVNNPSIRGWFFIALIFPFMSPVLDWFGIEFMDTEAMNILGQVVIDAIQERQETDQDYPDFVQACLNAHKEELDREAREALGEHLNPNDRGKGLTQNEIIGNAIVFLVAGYDTVSTALTFLMFDLADNPEWQERVATQIDEVIGKEEVTYDNLKQLTTLDMCLDETLRITPGLYRFERTAARDVTIKGRVIPKDTVLTIPVRALHHDPEFWEDPETYNPNRFTPEKKKYLQNSYMYLPFGAGPRNCVGMRLALVEVKMVAVRMLQKYQWSVSNKTQRPIKLDPAILVANIKGGMWLEIQRRV